MARTLPSDRWGLVGGLMVQAHAAAAGIESTRVTLDVDIAVRVEAGAFSYTEAAAALIRLGYKLDDSTRLAYRFTRDDHIVDLLVPDHEHPVPRYSRREVVLMSGGRQAMDRLEHMFFEVGGAEVEIPVPSLHGAVVLKAAAYTIDSRDRDRHLADAVTLLACITDPERIVADLRGSDRKRLMGLIRNVDERPLVAAQAPADTVRLAQRTLEDLRGLLF